MLIKINYWNKKTLDSFSLQVYLSMKVYTPLRMGNKPCLDLILVVVLQVAHRVNNRG